MKQTPYLIIGGSLNFFISIIHLLALFVGAPIYQILDAPALAFYAEMGSSIPFWLTFAMMALFLIFAIYAFCGAGSKIKLPFQSLMLKIIGSLFLFRGLALFWFFYLKVMGIPKVSLKEIGFSLFSLLIGFFYVLGTKKDFQLQKTQ